MNKIKTLHTDSEKSFAFYKRGFEGSFMTAFFDCIARADVDNAEALWQLAPKSKKAYDEWCASPDPATTLKKQLGEK